MSISSINIQTAKATSKAHMSRDKNHKITYLLDPDSEKNEYKSCLNSEKYLNAAMLAAKKITGRKMQQKAIEHFVQEAVLNLEIFHTVSDVEKVFIELKKEYGGFEIFDIAVHHDEGYFYHRKEELEYRPNRDIFFNDQDKKFYLDSKFKNEADLNQFEKRYNLHAHVLFSKFDLSTGKNPRLKKSDMSKIQTITAKALGMQRGELFSKAKRMSHWQLKKAHDFKRDEKKSKNEVLAKQKDLKEEISNLRTKLQEQGAKRPLYAKLEAENKELKELIKQKDLTIEELKKRLELIKIDFKSKDEEFIATRWGKTPKDKIELVTEELKSIPNERKVNQVYDATNSTLSKSVSYLLEKNTKTVEEKGFLFTETKEKLDLEAFILDLRQLEREHINNYKSFVDLFHPFKNFSTKVEKIVKETQALNTRVGPKVNSIELSYQQRIFKHLYKKVSESDLKGYYIDTKNKDITVFTNKQKSIKIVDRGHKITSDTGDDNQEEKVKLMLDIAEAKDWDLSTINIKGNNEFKEEIKHQIANRLNLSKEISPFTDEKEIKEQHERRGFRR